MLYIILSSVLLISLIFNVFLIISLKRVFFQIDTLEDWIVEFKNLINETYKKLKVIDDRDIFEKDDDVGIVFNEIKNIIELTNIRVQSKSDDEINKSRNNDEKN